MDELLLLELERLRQMLVIASKDVAKVYKCRAEDYLHDLSTRDYYEEYRMTEMTKEELEKEAEQLLNSEVEK